MTENAVEKARKAAEAAAAKLAEAEAAEASRLAQIEAERAERQRELDTEFLAEWKNLDAAEQEDGSKSPAQIVYEGGDLIQAVANFWVQRQKRNALRQRARAVYYRLHGEHPDDTFAMELRDRGMRLNLEDAIKGAADMHAADLVDSLEKKWTV